MNVEELTREQLENIVIQQSKQLQALQESLEWQKVALEKSEGEYEVLANVVMKARQVLSC